MSHKRLKLSDGAQETIVTEGVEWLVDLWDRRHYACEFMRDFDWRRVRRQVVVDEEAAEKLSTASELLESYTGNWQSGPPRYYDTWGQDFLEFLTDHVRESSDYVAYLEQYPDDADDIYDEAESCASKLFDIACAKADVRIAELIPETRAATE